MNNRIPLRVKMVSLGFIGDFIDSMTGDKKKQRRRKKGEPGFFDGLTLHFHIAVNLVQKERN